MRKRAREWKGKEKIQMMSKGQDTEEKKIQMMSKGQDTEEKKIQMMSKGRGHGGKRFKG